jgi:HAD superfamily hydrolase (TIGR01484 family)
LDSFPEFPPNVPSSLKFNQLDTVRALLFDLDGTVTKDDRIPPQIYQALTRLNEAGIITLAVTGRPAGWCDLIARWWPVDGVIGENGAFCFRRDTDGQIQRDWIHTRTEFETDRLQILLENAIEAVPGSAPAQDNTWRSCDIAFDFAEAVSGLSLEDARIAKAIFEEGGATAKISSIHVNAWFGAHSKQSTSRHVLTSAFGLAESQLEEAVLFVGDSPNDETMFESFPLSFGVAGLKRFKADMTHLPVHIAESDEADGFLEIVDLILARRSAAK